ncbi:MAG: hypothetical protein ABIJ96_16960 [Elusimicrobiota bacterium]
MAHSNWQDRLKRILSVGDKYKEATVIGQLLKLRPQDWLMRNPLYTLGAAASFLVALTTWAITVPPPPPPSQNPAVLNTGRHFAVRPPEHPRGIRRDIYTSSGFIRNFVKKVAPAAIAKSIPEAITDAPPPFTMPELIEERDEKKSFDRAPMAPMEGLKGGGGSVGGGGGSGASLTLASREGIRPAQAYRVGPVGSAGSQMDRGRRGIISRTQRTGNALAPGGKAQGMQAVTAPGGAASGSRFGPSGGAESTTEAAGMATQNKDKKTPQRDKAGSSGAPGAYGAADEDGKVDDTPSVPGGGGGTGGKEGDEPAAENKDLQCGPDEGIDYNQNKCVPMQQLCEADGYFYRDGECHGGLGPASECDPENPQGDTQMLCETGNKCGNCLCKDGTASKEGGTDCEEAKSICIDIGGTKICGRCDEGTSFREDVQGCVTPEHNACLDAGKQWDAGRCLEGAPIDTADDDGGSGNDDGGGGEELVCAEGMEKIELENKKIICADIADPCGSGEDIYEIGGEMRCATPAQFECHTRGGSIGSDGTCSAKSEQECAIQGQVFNAEKQKCADPGSKHDTDSDAAEVCQGIGNWFSNLFTRNDECKEYKERREDELIREGEGFADYDESRTYAAGDKLTLTLEEGIDDRTLTVPVSCTLKAGFKGGKPTINDCEGMSEPKIRQLKNDAAVLDAQYSDACRGILNGLKKLFGNDVCETARREASVRYSSEGEKYEAEVAYDLQDFREKERSCSGYPGERDEYKCNLAMVRKEAELRKDEKGDRIKDLERKAEVLARVECGDPRRLRGAQQIDCEMERLKAERQFMSDEERAQAQGKLLELAEKKAREETNCPNQGSKDCAIKVAAAMLPYIEGGEFKANFRGNDYDMTLKIVDNKLVCQSKTPGACKEFENSVGAKEFNNGKRGEEIEHALEIEEVENSKVCKKIDDLKCQLAKLKKDLDYAAPETEAVVKDKMYDTETQMVQSKTRCSGGVLGGIANAFAWVVGQSCDKQQQKIDDKYGKEEESQDKKQEEEKKQEETIVAKKEESKSCSTWWNPLTWGCDKKQKEEEKKDTQVAKAPPPEPAEPAPPQETKPSASTSAPKEESKSCSTWWNPFTWGCDKKKKEETQVAKLSMPTNSTSSSVPTGPCPAGTYGDTVYGVRQCIKIPDMEKAGYDKTLSVPSTSGGGTDSSSKIGEGKYTFQGYKLDKVTPGLCGARTIMTVGSVVKCINAGSVYVPRDDAAWPYYGSNSCPNDGYEYKIKYVTLAPGIAAKPVCVKGGKKTPTSTYSQPINDGWNAGPAPTGGTTSSGGSAPKGGSTPSQSGSSVNYGALGGSYGQTSIGAPVNNTKTTTPTTSKPKTTTTTAPKTSTNNSSTQSTPKSGGVIGGIIDWGKKKWNSWFGKK